jgi:hypothetical protein
MPKTGPTRSDRNYLIYDRRPRLKKVLLKTDRHQESRFKKLHHTFQA